MFENGFFSKLQKNYTGCPPIGFRRDLERCPSFGFTTQFTTVGYYLQRYWPEGNDFINQTCLVKGGCFWGIESGPWSGLGLGLGFGLLGLIFGLGLGLWEGFILCILGLTLGLWIGLNNDIGILKVFFDSKYDITYDSYGNPTFFTEKLDTCASSFIWVSIVGFIFFSYLAYLFLPFFRKLWMALRELLFNITQYPPFSFLLVWPLNELIHPNSDDSSSSNINSNGNNKSSSSKGKSRKTNDKKNEKRSKKDKKGEKEKSKKSSKKNAKTKGKKKTIKTQITASIIDNEIYDQNELRRRANMKKDRNDSYSNEESFRNRMASEKKRKRVIIGRSDSIEGTTQWLRYIWIVIKSFFVEKTDDYKHKRNS